jgi:hypothetical protein
MKRAYDLISCNDAVCQRSLAMRTSVFDSSKLSSQIENRNGIRPHFHAAALPEGNVLSASDAYPLHTVVVSSDSI